MTTTMKMKDTARDEHERGEDKKKPKITVRIQPPNIQELRFLIRGTTQLVVHRFSNRTGMEEALEAGPTKKGKRRALPAKDFHAEYEGARHVSTGGWDGVHAIAFKHALVSAC